MFFTVCLLRQLRFAHIISYNDIIVKRYNSLVPVFLAASYAVGPPMRRRVFTWFRWRTAHFEQPHSFPEKVTAGVV